MTRKNQNTECSPVVLLCRVPPVVLVRWDRKAAGQMGQINVTKCTTVGLHVLLRCSKRDSDGFWQLFLQPGFGF